MIQIPVTRADFLSSMPKLGLGVGLRSTHFNHILEHRPDVDWFEAISENFMDSGGRPRYGLNQIAEQYPLALHGVSMSIGSTDPLDLDYLAKLKRLADEIKAAWISDHLCWTGVLGVNSHDLLPLPLNEQTLHHVATRIEQVQDVLQRPLILENPSTYIGFAESVIKEPVFLRELVERTHCGLLLDLNNVFVSCFNDGTEPGEYLQSYPFEYVVQMHLAGHQHCGTHIIDTHDQPVCDAVWELFRLAWKKTDGASTLLEWDGNVPPFAQVHAEVLQAQSFMQGEFDLRRVQAQSLSDHESISNPVDFLVPEVMNSSRLKRL
ncbi:MAG: DUF692 domain-containing protein [Methylococcales bacterium]